jgi:hypothetical protein
MEVGARSGPVGTVDRDKCCHGSVGQTENVYTLQHTKYAIELLIGTTSVQL